MAPSTTNNVGNSSTLGGRTIIDPIWEEECKGSPLLIPTIPPESSNFSDVQFNFAVLKPENLHVRMKY